MKKAYLYFIIGALLLVDIVLIIDNRKVHRNYKKLINKTELVKKSLYDCRDLACFNKEFLKQNIDEIELILFIPSVTCFSSSIYALKFIEVYDALDPYLKVVFVGEYFNPNYQEKVAVAYLKVAAMESIFKDSFQLIRPTFVVMDKYYAHLIYEINPEGVFQSEKMKAFWAGAKSFFSDTYPKELAVK